MLLQSRLLFGAGASDCWITTGRLRSRRAPTGSTVDAWKVVGASLARLWNGCAKYTRAPEVLKGVELAM